MKEEYFLQIESSQRQHHEILLQSERMYSATIESDFKLFSLLKPKLFLDGDKWCCLYGDNIQNGFAGFGDSPRESVVDFNSAWERKIK